MDFDDSFHKSCSSTLSRSLLNSSNLSELFEGGELITDKISLYTSEPAKILNFDKKGIIEKIKEIEGVKRADTVTGPYDIILFGEAEGIPALEKMFYDVRNVDGVSRMTTCFAYQD